MIGWLRDLFYGRSGSSPSPSPARKAPVAPSAPLTQAPPEAEVVREFFNTVAGVTFRNPDGTSRQHIIRRDAKFGMKLRLRFEDDNPVDPLAVALLTREGQQIGYLHARTAADVREHVARGRWVDISVADTTGGDPGKPTLGVNIHIKILALPSEAPQRAVGFRAQVVELERSGRHAEAELLLLGDVARREGAPGATAAVSCWPYEKLANLYRKQKRFADEAAVLGRYCSLPETRRVVITDRLQRRLEQVSDQLGAGDANDAGSKPTSGG
jgi:hypothetical protein